MKTFESGSTNDGVQHFPWPDNHGADPFFLVEKTEDRYHTVGLTSCMLGHRIRDANTDRGGAFVSWDWNGHRLQVGNDEFGMYPLYYFAHNNVCAVSPSIPTLLALGAPRDFDDTALAVFLRLGYFIGEDTPFKFIRALPPNASLLWKDRRLELTGGLRPGKHTSITRSQGIEGYLALFRSGIEKRLSPNLATAVPLSGGRDSRHILLELCRAGQKPKICPTVALPLSYTNNESEVASRLASSLGVPHVDVEQELTPFHAEYAKNVVTNFCANEHAWFLTLESYLKGKVHVIFDGLGANALGDGFQLNERRVELCERADLRGLAQDLLGGDAHSVLLSQAGRGRLSRDRAIEHLEQELRNHIDLPNPVGSFIYWNRTRREIALSPYRILRHFQVLTPYCDRELYDCLASLPARLVADHQLHDDTIRLAFPETRMIPYSGKARATLVPRSVCQCFSIELIQYALKAKGSSFLSTVGVGSRLLRSLLDPTYSQSIHWIGPVALYFLQLEEMAQSSTDSATCLEQGN